MIPTTLQLQLRGTLLTTSVRDLPQRKSLSLTLLPWVCQRCMSQRRSPLRRKSFGAFYTAVGTKRRIFSKTTLRVSAARPNKRCVGLSVSSYRHNQGSRCASSNTRDELPSQEENRRSPISKRFNHVMDHLQSNLFIAGQRLNDLTGYSGIEALKRDIEEQGQHF